MRTDSGIADLAGVRLARSPTIERRSVDFPAPLGPTRPTTSPRLILAVKSWSSGRPSTWSPTPVGDQHLIAAALVRRRAAAPSRLPRPAAG